MAAPKKKPTTKKAPAKKPAAKKAPTKRSTKKAAPLQSFRASKSPQPFMSFQLTRQTFYWVILSVLILALGAWVIHLNYKVQAIYDQIDANNTLINTLSVPENQEKTNAKTQE